MELFNRREAAKMLGIGVRSLDKLRTKRVIAYYQAVPGGKVYFSQAHIDKYLERVENHARSSSKK